MMVQDRGGQPFWLADRNRDKKFEGQKMLTSRFWGMPSVMTIVIVPLLLPTLFGKRGIFTRSPLLWVFETLSFLCYHVHLPCFIILTGSIFVYQLSIAILLFNILE